MNKLDRTRLDQTGPDWLLDWLPGISMEIHGYPWISMDIHGNPWISMDIQGDPWISMDIYGYPWISIDIHGYLWISMDIHGYPWIPMDIPGNQSGPFWSGIWSSLVWEIQTTKKVWVPRPHPTWIPSSSIFLGAARSRDLRKIVKQHGPQHKS